MKLFDRIVKAAEGAALGTGTTMDYEMIGGTHDLLHVPTLQNAANLLKLAGFEYDDKEMAFAKDIANSLEKPLDLKYVKGVEPYTLSAKSGGSTDVGDVSYSVPTAGLRFSNRSGAWHTTKLVAAGGYHLFDSKKDVISCKNTSQPGMQLLDDISFIETVKKFYEIRGEDFKYVPLLGNREPKLDYRN